jgi:hypothetical protein
VNIVELASGKTVELPDELADKYIDRGYAKPAVTEGHDDEQKAEPAAPENKALDGAAAAAAEQGDASVQAAPTAEPPKRATRARRKGK